MVELVHGFVLRKEVPVRQCLGVFPCKEMGVPSECWSTPFCLEHFLAELLVVSAPLLAMRRGGNTSMFADLSDVTSESTGRVGDDCVVTGLVCDARLQVTRFFRHQDPHARWPRELRVWRRF